MGEYATFLGRQIKMGTCENMYYLRADQAHLVKHESASLDPIAEAASIRFRFPFPDEDDVLPGSFDPYDRGISLHCEIPDGIEHGTLQFSAPPGYLASLPCPESADGRAFAKTLPHGKIHRNGFPGAVRIVQQRCLDGFRMLVCACAGCNYRYRVPTLLEAAPYIEACIKKSEGPQESMSGRLFWGEMALRIRAGYVAGVGDLKAEAGAIRAFNAAGSSDNVSEP